VTLQPGQPLSHYRLIDQIGQGGMGVVWKALDTRLGREVALKLLPDAFAGDALRLARFEGEARSLAALNHPNIVTIHAIEEAQGLRFLVMELVRGRTLAALIPEGGLPLPRFFALAVPLADALRAAHERGVVHRDLKPRNVMIDEEGRPKVLDFGLARGGEPAPVQASPDDETPTSPVPGGIIGTPLYMAPEQLRGAPAGAVSDVFSLGVVLYEMATGRKPFAGHSSLDAIASVLKDTPPPPSALRAGFPARLDRLILACLDKDPARRPASAGPVCQELRAALADPGAAGNGAERSIAVLPFADMSEARDQGYFCEGVAEEILLALARVPGLRVAPRASSFHMRAAQADAREIGRRLGVATLLDGSVRKAASRLRVAVQLIDAADGFQRWSQRYERDLADVFAIQDEIAQGVVAALEVQAATARPAETAAAPPGRLDAYDYYLRGRRYYHDYNRRAVGFALDLFSHSVEADPSYARAHAGLADCHAYLFLNGGRDPSHIERALAASRRALELDPDLPEARVAHGAAMTLAGLPQAAEQFEAAIRLDPLLFDAHYQYARDCFARGDLARAAREFEAAMAARTEDYQSPLLVAQIYDDLGRREEAVAARRRGVALAEEHLRLAPDDARALYMGANGLVALGEREKGMAWADRALALDPGDSMVLYNIACIKALAGALDDALECLERAVAAGLAHRGWIEHDNNLDPIRGLPRFGALLASLAGPRPSS